MSKHGDDGPNGLAQKRHALFAAPFIAADVCSASLLAKLLQAYGAKAKVETSRWAPVLEQWARLVGHGLALFLGARSHVDPLRERELQAGWLAGTCALLNDMRAGKIRRTRVREVLAGLKSFTADGRRPANEAAAKAAHDVLLNAAVVMAHATAWDESSEGMVATLEELLQVRRAADPLRDRAVRELEAFLDLAAIRYPLQLPSPGTQPEINAAPREVQARRAMSSATLALLMALTDARPTATWDDVADDPLDIPAVRALALFYGALRQRLIAGGLVAGAELKTSALCVSRHTLRSDIQHFLARVA